MKIGILGTGAIAHKHVQAYRNIGWQVTACANAYEPHGRAFAEQYGCDFAPSMEALCAHPNVDIVDVCTFPDVRLHPVELCAANKKHVQVQKPISVDVETAPSRFVHVTVIFTPDTPVGTDPPAETALSVIVGDVTVWASATVCATNGLARRPAATRASDLREIRLVMCLLLGVE